jgi:hypothetical protein
LVVPKTISISATGTFMTNPPWIMRITTYSEKLNNYTPIFKIAALPRSQPAPPINDLRTSVPAPRFKVRE